MVEASCGCTGIGRERQQDQGAGTREGCSVTVLGRQDHLQGVNVQGAATRCMVCVEGAAAWCIAQVLGRHRQGVDDAGVEAAWTGCSVGVEGLSAAVPGTLGLYQRYTGLS